MFFSCQSERLLDMLTRAFTVFSVWVTKVLLLLLVLTFIGAVKIERGAVELNRLMQVVSCQSH